MVSKQTLQQAVDQGIINSSQLDPLLDFLNNHGFKSSSTTDQLDEPVKFIRSFGDIFISFGIVLLTYAITMLPLSGFVKLLPIIVLLGLCEWLILKRHLALPGITLLLSILFIIHQFLQSEYSLETNWHISLICLFSLLFYLRYRIPFSVFPIASGLVAIVVLELGLDAISQPIIFSVIGLLLFLVAMFFDMQDTKRKTHKSDTGFWLHLLSAPLMVHGLMATLLFTDQPWLKNISSEIIILLLFCLVFLLALLLDRRAMIISTQIYVIYAVTQLVQQQLTGTQHALMLVIFLLAIFVIFFGAQWYKVRKLIFRHLAGTAINRFVPDINNTGP